MSSQKALRYIRSGYFISRSRGRGHGLGSGEASWVWLWVGGLVGGVKGHGWGHGWGRDHGWKIIPENRLISCFHVWEHFSHFCRQQTNIIF